MQDVACIFLLYAIQGSIQGVVFGTLPLLVRRNKQATDVHLSQLSLAAYPFTLKFLIAPLVDGIYSTRVGRRESWLLPLQLVCAVALLCLSGNIMPMLEASPPDVPTLTWILFVLVAATAAGDIATDAWAAGRMRDDWASVCQSVGLTVGFQVSVTLFWWLSGKGLIDISTLLLLMSSAGFVVLALFLLRMLLPRDPAQANDANDGDDEVGVGEVLRRIKVLVGGSPNLRWWLAFSLLMPMSRGYGALLGVRYQELGFSPEIFAEYDLYLVPVSFATMWLGGKVAQVQRILTATSWVVVLEMLLGVASVFHFWRAQAHGEMAMQDWAMKTSYIVLSQLGEALGTIHFILNVTLFNRIAQRNEAIAGTVITFLASMSNLGGTLPGTWAPLLTEAVGFDATAGICFSVGLLVLMYFWQKLRCLENFDDEGWGTHLKRE